LIGLVPSNANSQLTRFGICFAVLVLNFAFALRSIAQENPLPVREEAALQSAVQRVAPSVVQIRTIGGLEVVEGTLLADGPTTGLVISPDGYIVSSAFNFAQKPSSILVTFASGKQASAELVATDHSRMLVLLKAAGAEDLPVPELAPTSEVRPGQWAVAVGRTFRADRPNVTVGIVSATSRMYGKVIQTDADASTANYGGPLVDIRGRVLGILVPMSPQATSELAGTEWYDSGIGFAVPLEPLAARFERMKKGEDQRAGLLGVGLVKGNPHSTEPELAVVRPDSPAGEAGLKKGDRIIEVSGKPIRNQSDMRFSLGTAYSGDEIKIAIQRGDERIEKELKLVGELPPFRHAFLGILPMRSIADDEKDEATDVVVRMVYADSPAAKAGIQAGDVITKINDTEIESLDDAMSELNNIFPESNVAVHVTRHEKPLDFTLTAARLPGSVPADLPLATKVADDPNATTGAGETTELKLPEFQHTCQVYVPGSHATGQPLGALLWLAPPGDEKPADIISSWQAACDRSGVVLVVPTPYKTDRWEKPDVEYLNNVMERVVSKYKIDPRRVIAGGQGNTGAIAWALAFAGRDMFRGVATSASPLPRAMKVPQNDPTQRLAIFAAIPAKKDLAAPITPGLKTVADAGYNLTTLTTVSSAGKLSDTERDELARWIDTLDRF
jgi:serine protease Do